MSAARRHLYVVPHTHWDREWYRTHEQFRTRLVRLLDRLLDLLEDDPDYRHFTLDGQAIVLDDYLEVRPGARARLEKLVRAGRLVVGPWFVLPDEWLVSGEALIRNLRLGLRKAREIGGGMDIGYVPDQFGHVGQLPQLFAGMGFSAAVLWRGVGADVERTLFEWEAPDGTRLLTVYLPQGYGNATQLPRGREALAKRLRLIAGLQEGFSDIPSLLLMNGSDHVEPEAALPARLAEAVQELPGCEFEIGTLPGFVARARAEVSAPLAVHRGELRSGLRAPLLPGCASSRIRQKQADFRNDRLLTRYLEPLAAWLGSLGGRADCEMLDFIWRIALENHPHDSICGCSIDAVHDQMETRFRRVSELAGEQWARVVAELGARVDLSGARFGRGAAERLLVWNPNGTGRALVEGELELDLPLRGGRVPALHVRDAGGRKLAAFAELVEPGRLHAAGSFPRHVVEMLLPGLGAEWEGRYVQSFATCLAQECLEVTLRLGRHPAPALDIEDAKQKVLREIAEAGVSQVKVEVEELPVVRLHFVDQLPGHGLRAYAVARGRAGAAPIAVSRRADGGAAIETPELRVEAYSEGRVSILHRGTGARVEDALRIVSEGDRGDSYNFDPVPEGEVVERPERARISVERLGETAAALRIDARYALPEALAPDRRSRAARRVRLPVTMRLRLVAGLDRVDVEVGFDNAARDHRLRLFARAPERALRFEVESAFEVALRPIAPARDAFGPGRPAELPIGAVPQRGFATAAGERLALTVANRGQSEVEAVHDGASTCLAVTLVRAIGWLSRADLALRPGPAGPGLATPGAQSPGPHRAELSLWFHPVGDAGRIREAHGFCSPPIAFPGPAASTPTAASLSDGSRLVEVDDPALVVSAIEPRPDRSQIVRIVNASDTPRPARIRCRGVGELERVDLAERPVVPAADSLRPWEIATFRLAGEPAEPSR
jgi:alpha-mannosidase